jgi:hypothetical protein
MFFVFPSLQQIVQSSCEKKRIEKASKTFQLIESAFDEKEVDQKAVKSMTHFAQQLHTNPLHAFRHGWDTGMHQCKIHVFFWCFYLEDLVVWKFQTSF